MTTSLWAQTASEELFSLSEGLKFIGTPETNPTAICPTDPYAQAVCTPSEMTEQPKAMVYKVTDPNQLSDVLKKQVGTDKIDKSSPLYISLSLINDNIADKKANDLYYTHGVLLQMWKTNSKGTTIGATYNTDLYTQRFLLIKQADGTVVGRTFTNWDDAKKSLQKGESYVKKPEASQDINFVEDSWLSLFANNKEKGEWFVWEAEAGFEKIEYQDMSKLGAANLQKILHNTMNLVKYDYHGTLKDDEYNAFLKASLGAQKKVVGSQICDVIIHGDVHGGYDLEGIRRYVGTTLGAKINFIGFKNSDKKLINLSSEVSHRQQGGGQTLAKAGADIQIKNWKVGYQHIIPLGSTQMTNNLRMNGLPTDREPMGKISITAPIGFKKKKNKIND